MRTKTGTKFYLVQADTEPRAFDTLADARDYVATYADDDAEDVIIIEGVMRTYSVKRTVELVDAGSKAADKPKRKYTCKPKPDAAQIPTVTANAPVNGKHVEHEESAR